MTVAALAVAAALAVVGPASEAVPKLVSAQYSGTLEVRLHTPPEQGAAGNTYTYELTWREHVSEPEGQEAAWTMDELKGSVKDVLTGAAGNESSCSATLSTPGTVGGNINLQPGHKIDVAVSIPWPTVAKPPNNGTNSCDVVPPFDVSQYATDQAVLARWAAVKSPTVTFPGKGSRTQPLDFSWQGAGLNGAGAKGGTVSFQLKSSLAFASPGFVIGSPKLHPRAPGKPPSTSIDPKALALVDLTGAVTQAVTTCLGLTAVLGAQATETAFALAEPITAPLALLAGQAITDITTDALARPLLTICTQQLKQIAVDYSVLKNDPPLAKAQSPLRPPSCTRWHGKPRAYCRKLETEATKLVAAERAVLPALQRLLSAGMTLKSARAKHNTQATASAQAKVNAAAAAVRAARAAARAAGKNVADTVRAAGVQGKLTKKQAEATRAAMLDQLAKQGVPTADIRKLAGSALTSAPTDLLTALAT